jgi:hypothetical protein
MTTYVSCAPLYQVRLRPLSGSMSHDRSAVASSTLRFFQGSTCRQIGFVQLIQLVEQA